MSGIRAKALIMVVSHPEAVEVAVEKIGAEVVGIIVSQNILEPVVMRCAGLCARATFRYEIVDSPMEIGDSFGRFEHLLAELKGLGYDPDDVLLDATGGTTPMRLGAALAAITRGMKMVHQRVPQQWVEGSWKVDREREIEVVPMDNPLESTGLLREGQAVQLFNRRDYGAAALVFEDVVKKVAGVERGHYYRGLLLLAEGYAAWDVADYATALGKLRAARDELGVGFAEPALAERSAELVGRVTAHLPFLGKVRGKLSTENVVDMVENARRRIEDQSRYDDGVARLYRAVEMWHQWRLLDRFSISTKQVEWERLEEDATERFLRATGMARLPEVLDLTRARTLDRILRGEAAQDDDVLRDLLRQRNGSILAHGLEPVSETSAERFLRYVDAMVAEPEVRAAAGHSRLREL